MTDFSNVGAKSSMMAMLEDINRQLQGGAESAKAGSASQVSRPIDTEWIKEKIESLKGKGTTGASAGQALQESSAPELAAPSSVAMDRLKNLSTDALMSLLSAEDRETTVQSGLESLKSNALERKQASDERIKNLQEQCEKVRKQKKLGIFGKIFGWISKIVTAVLAVGTLVAGAVTGNPLLIAGGVMLCLKTVNDIGTMVNGKSTLQNMLEGMGVSSKTAGTISGVFDAAMLVGATVCTMGAAMGASGASATMGSVGRIAEGAASVVNGAAAVGSGTVTIISGINQSEVASLQADQKLLQALIERLNHIQEADIDHIKDVMERTQSVTEGVKQVLKDRAELTGTILTGGAQAPA